MSKRVRRLLAFLPALLVASPLVGQSVQVLKRAPAVPYPCATQIVRSEAELQQPYEKLCTVQASYLALLRIDDASGRALDKAHKAACGCGANAIVVLSNTSDQQVFGRRRTDSASIVGVRLLKPPTPAQPPPPRPNPIKNGFRDLSWKDPRPTEMVGTDAAAIWRRPSDDLKIGGITVSGVGYFFLPDGLAGVLIMVPADRWTPMLEFLMKTWGNPDETRAKLLRWYPRTAEGEQTMIDAELLEDGSGAVGLFDFARYDKLEAEIRKQALAKQGL